MENGMNYLWFHQQNNMQGGDGLYGRMAFAQYHYQGLRDTIDPDLEHKTKKVADKMSENLNIIANEPSLAFFRIQEHVRKTLPQLVETKHEVQEVHQKVQGACFDTEYATNAVKSMHASGMHFQNIQDLLKNAMFMKQQIEYEDSRNSPRDAQGGGGPVAVGAGPGQAALVDEGVEAEEEELVAAFPQQPADQRAPIRPQPLHPAPPAAPPPGQETPQSPTQGQELVGAPRVSLEAGSESGLGDAGVDQPETTEQPGTNQSGTEQPGTEQSGSGQQGGEQPSSELPHPDQPSSGPDSVTEQATSQQHPQSGESSLGQPSDQEP